MVILIHNSILHSLFTVLEPVPCPCFAHSLLVAHCFHRLHLHVVSYWIGVDYVLRGPRGSSFLRSQLPVWGFVLLGKKGPRPSRSPWDVSCAEFLGSDPPCRGLVLNGMLLPQRRQPRPQLVPSRVCSPCPTIPEILVRLECLGGCVLPLRLRGVLPSPFAAVGR